MTHGLHASDCELSGGKGNWSALNIAAMVLGFVVFWPLGLVLLYWNIKGRDVRTLPSATRNAWAKLRSRDAKTDGLEDNIEFNEYQDTQYDRIREIKAEIEERARRCAAYRDSAKRRKDQEEFNDFMASAPLSDSAKG